MTDKLELKSSHEVVYTVYVADVDSIFQGKPTDPDILTVVMKGGRRLYCDEVCPVDSLQEEPVSEELEEEVIKKILYFSENFHKAPWAIDSTGAVMPIWYAKFGAKWQAEQFEKNRLKHCNSITNEQAELEQGFIDQHLDKYQRMPTYLDAIEYGMEKMKEEMMAKAVDGDITFDYYGDGDKTYGCIAHNSFCLEDFGLKDGDKVKIIVIKEEE